MAMTPKQEYDTERKNNNSDVRKMVMQAINQISEYKTKNFEDVCNRLEKRYTNA